MSAKIIPFDFEGHAVSFNTDGWINATEAAKRFGKEPSDWLSKRDTVEYLCALSKNFGKSGFVRELNEINDLSSTGGGSRAKILKLAKKTGLVISKAGASGGTWIHPRLAVKFAQWLSVDFEIWCHEQIDRILHGEPAHWSGVRREASLCYQVLTHALKQTRADQGKETRPCHYMNEAKLINACMNGQFKGVDRDQLSQSDLEMITMLESYNTFLLGKGMPYQQRKASMMAYAESIRRPRIAA